MQEHRSDPRRSKLKRMVPTIGSFFTPLKLSAAFREYDACFHISRRKYIPPNFAELRHILNIAQVCNLCVCNVCNGCVFCEWGISGSVDASNVISDISRSSSHIALTRPLHVSATRPFTLLLPACCCPPACLHVRMCFIDSCQRRHTAPHHV